jgi:hypothetical protein
MITVGSSGWKQLTEGERTQDSVAYLSNDLLGRLLCDRQDNAQDLLLVLIVEL